MRAREEKKIVVAKDGQEDVKEADWCGINKIAIRILFSFSPTPRCVLKSVFSLNSISNS